MAKKLSKISFMPAVESISRKFVPRKEKCVNQSIGRYDVPGKRYMGSYAKRATLIGYGPITKNIVFLRNPMSLAAPTQDELLRRARFSAANAWANAAWKDLSAITANQQKFKQAKEDFTLTISGVSAYGYQTMLGWMMAIAYKIQEAGGELPVNHKLPDFD